MPAVEIDDQGNTLELVDVPETGAVMWRTQLGNITPEQVQALIENGTPISGMYYLGLLTLDGGPAEESEGAEDIEYFQRGYRTNAGDVSLKFTVTAAETNATTHRSVGFSQGSTGQAGAQGRGKREALVYDTELTVLVLVKSRNGRKFAKWGHARVTNANVGKYERGAAITYEIEFTWNYWDGTETVAGETVTFDRGLYQWLVIESDGTQDRGVVNGTAVRSHAEANTPEPGETR